MRKYFGTDGVRGVANTELTCDLAYKLGRAGGFVLAQGDHRVKVVVGKDTRISGDMLEASLIAGLMSVGCDVITVGIIPTPAVAYLTKNMVLIVVWLYLHLTILLNIMESNSLIRMDIN